MAARIAELEDTADQARNRANKMEKDKNKLQIEVRDLTVQLESVSSSIYKAKLSIWHFISFCILYLQRTVLAMHSVNL